MRESALIGKLATGQSKRDRFAKSPDFGGFWRRAAGRNIDALRAAFPALVPFARQVFIEDDRRDRDKQADTTEHRNGCDRLKVGDRPNRCFREEFRG